MGRGRSSTISWFATLAAACAVVATLIAGCAGPAATPAGTWTPAAAGVVWLCRPGVADNPCQVDLTTTVLKADGSTEVATPAPAADPPIDCFYVYPTVSNQQAANADLVIDPEEIRAAQAQAARFSPVCRVYAPMYRSITHAGLNDISKLTSEQGAIAYGDVAAAFHEYLARYNAGRGIVFIGHSQGAWHVAALLANEFDADASMRRLLVSAIMLGGNVAVPAGQVVGGDFKNIPACTATGQVGCIVAYSSFSTNPTSNAWFGRIDTRFNPAIERSTAGDLQVLCTNPANLAGGSGVLKPYFLSEELAFHFLSRSPDPTTTWVSYPDEYTAHCESADGTSWLQIDVMAGASETRPTVQQADGPWYGLHNVDLSIAIGNLVELVQAQGATFTGG